MAVRGPDAEPVETLLAEGLAHGETQEGLLEVVALRAETRASHGVPAVAEVMHDVEPVGRVGFHVGRRLQGVEEGLALAHLGGVSFVGRPTEREVLLPVGRGERGELLVGVGLGVAIAGITGHRTSRDSSSRAVQATPRSVAQAVAAMALVARRSAWEMGRPGRAAEWALRPRRTAGIWWIT